MDYHEFLERLRNCHSLEEVNLHDSGGDGRESDAYFRGGASYGDCHPLGKAPAWATPAFEVRHAGGSDYSGGAVETANYNVLTDPDGWGKLPGVVSLYGGYNSYGVVIVASRELARHDDAEGLLEVLEGLDDYPLVDEDELCRVEYDAFTEAWSNWIASDFANAIGRQCETDRADEIDDRLLLQRFRRAENLLGEYVIFETGNSPWVDVDKLAKSVTRLEVARLLRETRKLERASA